jgi:hypothetical protein
MIRIVELRPDDIEYARPLVYRRATGTSPICWRAHLLGKCRRREQKG